MARPVEFEYDVVLEKAMEQFWREGYEASSVQKLLDVTGINRGTLYNSFGDKDTFFKSCLEKYNSMLKAAIDATLGNEAMKPWEAIHGYFEATLVGLTNRQRQLGNLLVNSVCESINWDKEIQKILRNSINGIRKPLLARTKELEKAGQLRKGLSAEVAADLLLTSAFGLAVHARNGKAAKQLTELLEASLDSLKK